MNFSGDQLHELIASGVLPVGSELFHTSRPSRGGKTTVATVVADGIKLRGRTYLTPSAAAQAITGKPADGWLWWRLKSTGLILDTLRHK